MKKEKKKRQRKEDVLKYLTVKMETKIFHGLVKLENDSVDNLVFHGYMIQWYVQHDNLTTLVWRHWISTLSVH